VWQPQGNKNIKFINRQTKKKAKDTFVDTDTCADTETETDTIVEQSMC